MYSFLVLGIIPGTNVQITWQSWLNVFGLTVCTLALRFLYVNRAVIEMAMQPVREPLPASRLHARLQY